VVQERQLGDGKVERKYSDGRRVVTFRNGTEKELTADGQTIVRFGNGDVKRTNPQTGAVVYYYAEAQTTHTTLADGTETFEFPSGQHETHFPNGSKEIFFPDGTVKTVGLDGVHRSVFPDGTSMVEYPDGRKVRKPSVFVELLKLRGVVCFFAQEVIDGKAT
jgi:centromere protein J